MPVQRIVAVGWNHRPPRRNPLRDAPVILVRLGVTARADDHASGRLDELKLRSLVSLKLCAFRALVKRVGVQLSAMQPGDM